MGIDNTEIKRILADTSYHSLPLMGIDNTSQAFRDALVGLPLITPHGGSITRRWWPREKETPTSHYPSWGSITPLSWSVPALILNSLPLMGIDNSSASPVAPVPVCSLPLMGIDNFLMPLWAAMPDVSLPLMGIDNYTDQLTDLNRSTFDSLPLMGIDNDRAKSSRATFVVSLPLMGIDNRAQVVRVSVSNFALITPHGDR